MELVDVKIIRAVVVLVWVATLSRHPFLALYLLPTMMAFARDHRCPLLVAFLNVALGWTPAWLLIMLFALEHPDHPMRVLKPVKSRLNVPPIKFNKKDKVITI